MFDELIIAEKPSSARKIAEALAENKVIRRKHGKLYYFEVQRSGKRIAVVGAAGHLYGVAERKKNGFNHYPVFDVEWKPLYAINRSSSYTRDYISLIRKLSKEAKDIIIATDYDIEGEAIGYNILRFICGRKNAKRMLFSTLTKEELVKAYENARPTILIGLANAGVTRHVLDYFWGINVSRALMSSAKKAGRHYILSSGRVQGPALRIIYEREQEIRNFIPTPYWKLGIVVKGVRAEYEAGRIMDGKVASELEARVRNAGSCIVVDVEKKIHKHNPPVPFNLNDLQAEAYALFRLTPKKTQEIAQKLYELSLISYPRTSSQKLPRTIDFRKIISKLSREESYKEIAEHLLGRKILIPNEGKKEDEAHPAIHPTGENANGLNKTERKVYDLIVRRFLSCFMEPAEKRAIKVVFESANLKFVAKGLKTIKEGWYIAYRPYLRVKDTFIPEFRVGEKHGIDEVVLEKKMTTPPERYTPASLVRELERRNLGTKATRAEIVQNLYDRGYIKGSRMELTPLGETVVKVLMENAERIVDEQLTREFEEKLEKITKNAMESEAVIEEARESLSAVLKEFKERENKVGEMLVSSIREMEKINSVVGKCECGGNLIIRKGKNGKRFVSCDTYPKCKKIYPLPSKGKVEPTGKICDACKTPVVKIIMRTGRPWLMCLDPECKKKKKVSTRAQS